MENEMTIATLMEIALLREDEAVGPVSYRIELCSIFLDEDPAVIRKWPIKELKDKYQEIEKTLANLDERLTAIELEGETFDLMPFTAINLGEYIDLDNYITAGKMGHVLAVLYRKHTGGGLNNTVYEKYSSVNVDRRAELILQLPANGTSSILREYGEFRKSVIDSYDMFGSEFVEEDINEDEMTESELKMLAAEKQHDQFAWESFILFLANDDITKWEEVCSLPLYFALNMASYKKSVGVK
jgi:hypothetical protein